MRYNPAIVIAYWTVNGLPEPVAEYKFHPVRRWRFDFAFPEHLLAVEIQGATFGFGKPCPMCKQRKQGGHNRGGYIKKEHEKRNAASLLGWRIVFCIPQDVCTLAFVHTIKEALSATKEGAVRE